MPLTMARPKKPGSPKQARSYRLPENLLAALETLAERNRRPVTNELEIALEKHLESNQLWPPPESKKSK